MNIMSGIIMIGSSDTNLKVFNINNNFKNNFYIIKKNNWISNDIYNDVFEVTILDGICSVKRIDLDTGWGIDLIIYADILNKNDNIPVFFINLEKDTERLIHIQNILNKIFNLTDIYRICGVKHEIGMEGCRLAHINAHIDAISSGFNYYIIAEDDIQPLVNNTEIINYIKNTINICPDLVLFEQGERLEQKIELIKEDLNLYRILSGGNNAGCYLCSRNFGIKLVQHWVKSYGRHIDHSWQDLWKENNIYFHRPQLFHQKEGYSNQNDVDFREVTKPFNWELYENYQKILK